MRTIEDLKNRLLHLDGQDYGGYQSLIGEWRFPDFELWLERIPKDPYAPPGTGVFRVRIPLEVAGFSADFYATPIRAVAFRDFLARRFFSTAQQLCGGRRATGSSGLITMAQPGQACLERSSVVLPEGMIEARIFVGLPARKRIINQALAALMLFEELPAIVKAALYAGNQDLAVLEHHLCTVEDAEALRASLPQYGLVAFVADGAILPRASGVSDAPLPKDCVVPFRSPESLRVSLRVPNAGVISGMGIPEGVTLIVGGGYHGKSTLLQALECGIYNHIPGDGREFCVALSDTVKVRAASGRCVTKTDISAFIGDLPRGPLNSSKGSRAVGTTREFSSANASGSTSQAAFISEAIEVGCQALLLDEDTCATNFMIRDKRMQELVSKDQEPITAFVDKVRQLYDAAGISTILVMGGCGDYFSVADCVIQLTDFEASDVTARAREIAGRFVTERTPEGGDIFTPPLQRQPDPEGLDPLNEYGQLRIGAGSARQIQFGREQIDLVDVEQVGEISQARAIGRALWYARQYMQGGANMREIATRVATDIRRAGLDILDDSPHGDLAQFRPQEFAAALNRFRQLKIR